MQTAPMPLENTPPQIAAPSPHRVAQVLLAILAILQTYRAVLDMPILLGDLSKIPGPGLGGWTITAVIAMSPFVAFAAVAFALTGRIRHAIVAIAALGLLDWLNYLPSLTLQDLVPSASVGSMLTLLEFVVFPTICVAAIRLCLRDERLGLVALMAAIPLLFSVLGIIAFTISVAIYGF